MLVLLKPIAEPVWSYFFDARTACKYSKRYYVAFGCRELNECHRFFQVDRASALTLFFLQCGKWFVVPLDFPTNWIVFVLLWVAGIIFLIASTHFGNVLTCSGIAEKECGGAVVSSKTKANTSTELSTARTTRDLSGNNAAKAPALADDESSLLQLTEAGLERRDQADGKRSKQKPRNRTPSGKKAALSNQLTVGSRKNSTASTVSTSASSTKSTKLVATQNTLVTKEHAPSFAGTPAALVVETHFKAYLFWHTLWHVALPVPGILTLASFRTEYGLPVLPTWALSEDMFSHLVTGAW